LKRCTHSAKPASSPRGWRNSLETGKQAAGTRAHRTAKPVFLVLHSFICLNTFYDVLLCPIVLNVLHLWNNEFVNNLLRVSTSCIFVDSKNMLPCHMPGNHDGGEGRFRPSQGRCPEVPWVLGVAPLVWPPAPIAHGLAPPPPSCYPGMWQGNIMLNY